MTTDDPKLAILMLCCRDYEAVELALACHMAYGDPAVPFFVLQNCRGDYDSERTLAVLWRYASLYPQTIRLIDELPPDFAYPSVMAVLRSEAFQDFDLVCKVDDDTFPVAGGWIQDLLEAWKRGQAQYGEKLAYVTPLINNNCWGFPETLKVLGLEQEYFAQVARPHWSGPPLDKHGRRLVAPADTIDPGSYGTIWNATDIARWLHERSTLQPDRFIEATRGLPPVLVPNHLRYSIGCVLFKKELWASMDDGSKDDEEMIFRHCRDRDLKIVCARSVPFVHLTYCIQKEELRDVIRKARDLYSDRLCLRHTIAGKASQLDEVESRLRYLERRMGLTGPPLIGPSPRPDDKPLDVEGPDARFTGRPNDELSLEEQAARESSAWIEGHMGQSVRARKPVETLRRAIALAPRGGLALEFGVGGGATLRVIADARADGRVWGFDSFEGLPEAWRPGFPMGAFAQPAPEVPGAELVVGLFDKTLPQFLVDQAEPIDFVHVDCDLYSSTLTVLNLLEHRLRPGTVLSFDEYFNYPGWQQHEHKAWMEFIERTGRKFAYEIFTLGDEQVAVRLLK